MGTMNERLKQLRKEKGLTQQELSKIINISRGGYAQYETGAKQPSLETLMKLAEFYKTSTDYILGRY